MPAARPTAFGEQLELRIATVPLLAKFLQPLNSTYHFCPGVKVESYFTTEFVTIACGIDEGQLWCWAASSAAEAMNATPGWYACSTASRAGFEFLSVPSSSWITMTSFSTA